MHSLILFASGRGSNVRAIATYFREHGGAAVSLIVTNREDAGVLDFAREAQIPFLVVDRETFRSPEFLSRLQSHNPSLLVLAGFLWKVPAAVVNAFRGRIINIHPALLPAYGGKGMYGDHVHRAVIAAGERFSGITIHQVDEIYDNGDIILQARCPVLPDDDAATLAERIHQLEHFYYPRAIAFLLEHPDFRFASTTD